MANKVSTQLLTTVATRQRARALAIIRDEKQAEVLRELVVAALPGFEAQYGKELEKLYRALEEAGIDRESGIENALKQGMTLEQIVSLTPAALKRTLRVKG